PLRRAARARAWRRRRPHPPAPQPRRGERGRDGGPSGRGRFGRLQAAATACEATFVLATVCCKVRSGGRARRRPGAVTADEQAAALGLEIPAFPELPFRPKLRPVLVHGGLAYLSGIGPIGLQGRGGEDITVEEGYDAARTT